MTAIGFVLIILAFILDSAGMNRAKADEAMRFFMAIGIVFILMGATKWIWINLP